MSGGLTRGKSNRHSKDKNYYASGFSRVVANKAKRAKRRAAWLAHRQSLPVRERLARGWCLRHINLISTGVPLPVYRYGIPVYITHRTKESYNA